MPFTITFWVLYFLGGLSDFLDGYVARKFKQQSTLGAKLDSIADVVFAVSVFIVVVKNVSFPAWLWFCLVLIALLRVTSYGIGFYKYRSFIALHTYANKVTGVLLFAFPLFYIFMNIKNAGAVLCLVAFISAIEELAITIKSKEPNRDCKSIFQ